MGAAPAHSVEDNKHATPPTSGGRTAAAPARFKRALRWILPAATLAVVAGFLLAPAWHETCRREAYLPQLEAEDRSTPFDGRLLALIGGEQMQAGEFAAAADTLRRAVAAGEQDRLVWLNVAAAAAAAGDTEQAAAGLTLGLKAHPDDPLLQEAKQRVQVLPHDAPPGQIAGAISPDGPETLVARYSSGSFLNFAASWWGHMFPDSAGFRTRQEMAEESPGDARANWRWGLALVRSRRNRQAVEVLKKSVSEDRAFAPAHLAFADSLSVVGRTQESTQEYLEALKLHPNWAPALVGLGKDYLDSGVTEAAADCFTRASTADPKNTEAWIGLGVAYQRTGTDQDRAIAAFRKAEQLAPDRTDFLVEYAEAFRQKAEWQNAEALLARRLKAAPDDALAHYTLGKIMLNDDPTPERQTAAEAETREALRLIPHNGPTEVQLAQIVLAKGQAKEAIALLTDSLRANPYNPNALTALSQAYRRAGKIDLADKTAKNADQMYQSRQQLRVFEQEYSKQVMDPDYHERFARLLSKMGETHRAESEVQMEQLLRTDPRRAAAEIEKVRMARSAALPSR